MAEKSPWLTDSAEISLSPEDLRQEQALKFRIMADGLHVDPGAEVKWLDMYGSDRPISLREYASTSGVCLFTDNQVFMNAPYKEGEGLTEASEFSLAFDEDSGRFCIDGPSVRLPVNVVPVPAFANRLYEVDGEPVVNEGRPVMLKDFGITHIDRVRVSPIEGCAYGCQFCDLPMEFKYRPKRGLEAGFLEVIKAAAEDPLTPARHVLISGGTPREGEDEEWLDQVFQYICEQSPLPVDIMMTPRKKPDYLSWLKEIGVNSLSINTEVYNPDIASKLIRAKRRDFSLEEHLAYLDEAVKVFGPGQVQSLIIAGSSIEPVEETLKGVEEMVKVGCLPVISPFRPDKTTILGGLNGRRPAMPPASYEEISYVVQQTEKICRDNPFEWNGEIVQLMAGPRCEPCSHNTAGGETDKQHPLRITWDDDIKGHLTHG